MAVALSNYVVDNETGEYIDIRDDTLSHYEKGDRPIPVFILCAYADYLGIDVQSLIPDMKNYKFFLIKKTSRQIRQMQSQKLLYTLRIESEVRKMSEHFIFQCAKSVSDAIMNFIIDFKGGEGDEEDFDYLMRTVNRDKIFLSSKIQKIIDGFY